MKLTPEEDFERFLEQYPACYSISKSKLFLFVLNYLLSSPKSFSEVSGKIWQVSEQDVNLILSALIAANLVKKKISSQSEIYVSTDLAREFIQKLLKTEASFE